MSTHADEVLRLPRGLVPGGCPDWDRVGAERWVRELPARWVPLRARMSLAVVLPMGAVSGAATLGEFGQLPGWAAAVVFLQVVWVVYRPEAALVFAPVGAVVVVALGDWPWIVRGVIVGALVVVGTAAALRLAARRSQRAVALEAAGGVTAVLPEAVGGRPERGGFLFGFGVVTVVAGGVLYATAGLWPAADDRQGAPAAGWALAGLGLTLVLSGALARRRAVGLRAGPVPVLRVLVRDGEDGDPEVFAADDTGALRPLFTVATREAGDREEDGDEEEELPELFDDERVGPLREAVLYGVPSDGAEVVLLAAAAKAGEAPVVEVGTGPVRPVSAGTVWLRDRRERGRAAQEVVYEARRRGVAERIAAEGAGAVVKVRRWRAGWADWISVTVVVLYGVWFTGTFGWWRYVWGLGLVLLAARVLPRLLAWRVTADREGLWFNGCRGVRQLAWDDVRAVRCRGVGLRIVGTPESFGEWSVDAFRWPWLERRLGVLHPYERTAAEITAMWRDPELRPVGVSDVRQRGSALWPSGVAIAVFGVTAVFLLL
ncbi:hypothetical protein ACWD25_27210 [Streptomyces sp. NPDC002920]